MHWRQHELPLLHLLALFPSSCSLSIFDIDEAVHLCASSHTRRRGTSKRSIARASVTTPSLIHSPRSVQSRAFLPFASSEYMYIYKYTNTCTNVGTMGERERERKKEKEKRYSREGNWGSLGGDNGGKRKKRIKGADSDTS